MHWPLHASISTVIDLLALFVSKTQPDVRFRTISVGPGESLLRPPSINRDGVVAHHLIQFGMCKYYATMWL